MIIKSVKRRQSEKEKAERVSSVFAGTPLYFRASWAIEIAGTILLSVNLIMDVAYLFKQTFAGAGLYATYCVLMAIRFMIPLLNALRYCINKLG